MQPASASPGPVDPGRDRPRFRQDLIAETIEHQGARFIDVMAPEGNDVFRFYEVEYSLACGMDGERDVAGIVKWAQDELGLTPSPQEVRAVIAALGDLGFIEAAAAAAAEAAAAEAPEVAVAVVAEPAARAARPTPSGFEIGGAGVDHGDTERSAVLPLAPDLALGAAGVPRAALPTPQAHDVVLEVSDPGEAPDPGEQLDLQTDEADVSIDLSDHIAVRPDDVKEAVRASRVMSAVEPPPDASSTIEVIQDPPTAPASAFDAPTVARIPDPAMLAELTPRPPPSYSRSAESPPSVSVRMSDTHKVQGDLPTADTIRVGKTQLRAPASAVKPPVELPGAPVTVKVDKPMPPPMARSGTSPLLLVVLILAILGAGVFFAWKYVLERPAIDVDTSSAPVKPTPVTPAPPPPPPPPPPTAKIVLETPDPEDVKVMRQGQIESIPGNDTAVKEAEVIAKLKGYKPVEAAVNAMTNDLTRQRALLEAAGKVLDTAHAAGNKAKEAAAQAEVNERRKLVANRDTALTAKRADLDTYQVRAPRNGTFMPSAKLNAMVAADTVIGKLVRESIPVATFKLGNTHSFAANGSVEISVHKGEQRVTCTVTDVQADSVKLTCPPDPELTEGLEVVLQLPGATSAAPPEPPPLPSGAGSGSGPPAEPAGGSGAPPAPPAPGETPGGSGAPVGSGASGEPAGGSGAPPSPSGAPAPAAGSGDKP